VDQNQVVDAQSQYICQDSAN